MYVISEKAVVARINRHLAHKYMAVRKPRSLNASNELGKYYVHNFNYNCIVFKHIDPESYARELGVLEPHEQVAENLAEEASQ